MNPRAKRKAATISQTVAFENPERASCTVKSRSSMPTEMTITIIEPAGSGRVISEQMVAANRQRNPQLRGANPPCGSNQTTAATASGAAQRHRLDSASGTHLYMRNRQVASAWRRGRNRIAGGRQRRKIARDVADLLVAQAIHEDVHQVDVGRAAAPPLPQQEEL